MTEIKPNSKVLLVLLHVVLWTIFLALPAIFRPRTEDVGIFSAMLYDILEPPRWTNALLLLAIFYFNYFYAIPRLYLYRKYLLLIATVCVAFTAFYFLNSLQMPEELREWPSGGFDALGNSFNLFMFLIVYAASFAVCLYEQWQQTREQMLNTEISFLKAQINPHFLFNTLNSIYSLTLTKSDNAPGAILKLSGMMRYSVSDASHTYVPLAKEMDYISNYIELQKLRLTDNVKISWETNGHISGKQIAPFLLIPFVENAFKYGVNSEENSDIRIVFDIGIRDLNMTVCNNKVFVRQDRDNSTGLGINTTRKRLELMYPGRHKLQIEDTATDFKVSLQIDLS